MGEAWTILFAEAEVEPSEEFHRRFEGAFYLGRRLWLWWGVEEMRGKAFPLGQHPIYGTVYIRPLRSGMTLEELHADPAVQELLSTKLRQFEDIYVKQGEASVGPIWEWAEELGLVEEFERLRDELIPVRKIYALLSQTPGVPVAYRDRKTYLQGRLPVETFEEAQRVVKAYQWANRRGIRLVPFSKERGLIVFLAENTYRLYPEQVELEGPKACLPLKGWKVDERIERSKRSGRMMGVIPRDYGEGIFGELVSLGGTPEGIRILYHRD